MATNTTAKYRGKIIAETEAGGQVVELDGGGSQMTFWGKQRAVTGVVGDAVIIHRAESAIASTWWVTLATQENK